MPPGARNALAVIDAGAGADPRHLPSRWLGRVNPHLDLPGLWLAAIVVHGPALRTWFAQDDVTFLARAMGLSPIPWSMSRPLFEGVTFRALHVLFGLDPLPFHLANLLLHLLNVALIHVIGRRLLESRAAAFGATLLFAVSSIGFTPLHWATGIVELQAAAFALGAIWLYILARERRSTPLLWAGAVSGLAAALTKENAAFLPLVLLIVEARCAGRTRPGVVTRFEPARLLPQTLLSGAFLAAYLATIRYEPFASGEAYARTASPAFLLANLATYAAWCAAPLDPFRDMVATAHPELLGAGLLVGGLGMLALWTQRRGKRHPEEVGAVALLTFLLPVLSLEYHSYLYYLYLPWAGACWLVAGVARRLARVERRLEWAMLVLAAAFVPLEVRNVWTREHARLGVYARDKTMRESELLSGAVRDLRAARLSPNTRVGFILVGPEEHIDLHGSEKSPRPAPTRSSSYLPLEAALRGGEALRVFVPGVELLGFARTVPPEWEDAQLFLCVNVGPLQPLGTGSLALAQVGELHLGSGQWVEASRLFARTRERGDTLAPATLGLAISEEARGNRPGFERYAREFLARWPGDPRATAIDWALRTNGSLTLRE